MTIVAVTALVLAALFAGAALYISLVEHPARLGLDDIAMLAQWQPSYARALPIQAGLAIAGSLAGFATWSASADSRWLVGTAILFANWPFTFAAIMPINKRLHGLRPSEAGLESRTLLVRWGALHNVRSLLGSVAVLFFGWALIATG